MSRGATSDAWLSEHEKIERLGQTISQTLNERNKQPKSSNQYSNISANIRVLLNKFSASIVTLSKNLDESHENGSLTQHEYSRRCNMVNKLKTSEKQFEKYLRDDLPSSQKESLINSSNNTNNRNNNVSSSLWSDINENDFTHNLSSEQLLAQHDTIIAQQDRGLETLSHIVGNQKQIAITIGSEIDRQNVLIDNIGDKVDNVNERLLKETTNVKKLDKKMSTFGLWLLIILLLIAIIVISVIPIK